MNTMFLNQFKTILTVTMICGIALFTNQPVFAQPPASAEGNNIVDKAIFNGWHIYRTEACGSCHGATGEGNVSNPNLLLSLKNQTKEHFRHVLIDGHGIAFSFSANKTVVEGVDDLYAYLKGRSNGVVPAGDLIEKK